MLPRLLHIIPHDGIGGVEVAARTMAARSDLPCDFSLLLVAGRSLSSDRQRIVESRFRSPLNPLAQLTALITAVRFKPDAIVASLWRSVPTAVAVRLLRPRTRLVFFLHAEKHVHAVDALFSTLAMRLADEIWADSAVTLQSRMGSTRKPTRVISFVTTRLGGSALPAADPKPHFISWSRLAHQKGIDRALQFIAALGRRGVEARFDMWGPDDGEGGHLTRLASELEVSACVNFRGPVERSRLAEIAEEASFFLQLSRFEGMAMGVVEAMQLGLVPVTTAVGEMARYVTPGSTGVIVDPEAIEPGLKEVQRLLECPDEYRRVRENAVAAWRKAPLYADDMCAAAHDLLSGRAA